jgi:hypothetical protein
VEERAGLVEEVMGRMKNCVVLGVAALVLAAPVAQAKPGKAQSGKPAKGKPAGRGLGHRGGRRGQ